MTGADPGALSRAEREARLAAVTALAERAEDVLVLDLRNLAGFTDFFVIATASSERRRQTVVEAIRRRLLEEVRRKPTHIEGSSAGGWLLADYVDFVVHIFSPNHREFYQLERLWGDAPRWAPEPSSALATDGGVSGASPPPAPGGNAA